MFNDRNRAITQGPMLALSNFTKKFIIYLDASGDDNGAILVQEKRFLAFISKALGLKKKSRSMADACYGPCNKAMETLSLGTKNHYYY